MINFLKGKVKRLYPEESKIVLDVHGVGYELLLPYFVWRSLEEEFIDEGNDLEMEIYFHSSERQPKPVLVGFRQESEKSFFEKLIQVEDVGVNTEDMEHIRSMTKHVTGISEDIGGGGDPSPITAYGVYMGMKASAKFKWGNDSLEGKKILVQGVGHVGAHLVKHILFKVELDSEFINYQDKYYGIGFQIISQPIQFFLKNIKCVF